ncbi:MAG: alpha/beta fold hydrolase [Phycisphaerales bacterium]|nr:alpha/beta fold hydrolase [Phycisphaerales bacterium]
MNDVLHPAVGLLLLLSVGALVAWGLYAAGVWREAVHPPRRGMAWALARGLPASPSDLGLDSEERTVATPGAEVPGWWIAGRGPADGPTVVFVHGHGRSRWDSLRRIGPWVDRSPLLVLVDLRGHGDAPGPSTLGRREHADLEAVVAEAERRRPGAPVELVGHSLGAVVAIRTAARRAAAGAPLAAVHAFGPYDGTRTPLEARLRVRGLPARPASDLVLWIAVRRWGAEEPLSAAAARLGPTRLVISADEHDDVSPLRHAHAIAARAPGAVISVTEGVAHGDLGVPEAAAGRTVTSSRRPSQVQPPAPPTAA